ncbi:MAG: glycosyltransferase family 2 protein [Verrucomicrobiales bacterium]
MKRAIVIPSYRAEKTLPGVLERIPENFWGDKEGVVVIINDCSPDKTGEVAENLKTKWPWVEVVHQPQNTGYGGAQKAGLHRGLEVGAQAFAVVHADGQYAPELAMDLMAPIFDGRAKIVQGSRMLSGGALKGGMPLIRYIPNRALTFLENSLFRTKMADFHSGYMIYSRELLEAVPIDALKNNYNFDAEMIIMANLLGWKCMQIGIPTRYDGEISSLDPIPYGINVLKMMGRYTKGHYHKLLKEHKKTLEGRSA